jgi:drug/metabolite transporter (DMT)-like permease
MQKTYKSVFYIVATAFLFSTMEVALKFFDTNLNTIQLAFLRFFIGGALLLPFALADLKKRGCRLTGGDWLYLLFLGVACVPSLALLQVSVLGINANLAAVIISANPLFTMIFAHFVADEPLTKRKVTALCLMLAGLVIVADPRSLVSSGLDIRYLGYALLSTVLFGLYSACSKRRIGRIGGMAQNAFSFLLGSGVLLLLMLPADIPVLRNIGPADLPCLLYMSVFVTGIAYIFYLRSIELSGPSVASIAFFLKPIMAPILAFLVLHERFTLSLMLGVLFILLGSYVNLAPGLKKA